MPAILSELVERGKTDVPSNANLVVQLKAGVDGYDTERQRVLGTTRGGSLKSVHILLSPPR